MTGGWVPHDTRDAVVDLVRRWSDKANIALKCFIRWLAVAKSKFYSWIERYGKANEHNAPIPRDFWLEQWEREAIISFHIDNPLEGYSRLTFMMLDRDIVAVSPATTWRVLSRAGLLAKWNKKKSLKGTGFVQPLKPQKTGTWISPISISTAPFTISAASWTDAAATSSTGRSESR